MGFSHVDYCWRKAAEYTQRAEETTDDEVRVFFYRCAMRGFPRPTAMRCWTRLMRACRPSLQSRYNQSRRISEQCGSALKRGIASRTRRSQRAGAQAPRMQRRA